MIKVPKQSYGHEEIQRIQRGRACYKKNEENKDKKFKLNIRGMTRPFCKINHKV